MIIWGEFLGEGGRKFWKNFRFLGGATTTPPRWSLVTGQKSVIFHYFRVFFALLYTELMKSGTMVKKWKVGQKNG